MMVATFRACLIGLAIFFAHGGSQAQAQSQISVTIDGREYQCGYGQPRPEWKFYCECGKSWADFSVWLFRANTSSGVVESVTQVHTRTFRNKDECLVFLRDNISTLPSCNL